MKTCFASSRSANDCYESCYQFRLLCSSVAPSGCFVVRFSSSFCWVRFLGEPIFVCSTNHNVYEVLWFVECATSRLLFRILEHHIFPWYLDEARHALCDIYSKTIKDLSKPNIPTTKVAIWIWMRCRWMHFICDNSLQLPSNLCERRLLTSVDWLDWPYRASNFTTVKWTFHDRLKASRKEKCENLKMKTSY